MSAKGQLSMPTSLLGSARSSRASLTSLGSLSSFQSEFSDVSKSTPTTPTKNRRSWTFNNLADAHRDPDSVSILSIDEELDEGVLFPRIALIQLFFTIMIS